MVRHFATNAFGNALGNALATSLGATPSASVSDGDGDHQLRVVPPLTDDELRDLNVSGPDLRSSGEAETGVRTYALGDINAPSSEQLALETLYADGGDGYYSPPRAQPEIAFAGLSRDRGLVDGLIALNEATRIPLLGDIKQGARGLLSNFADYSIASGWPDAVGGGIYAFGEGAAQLFLPETGLEVAGGALGMLGKTARLGRTVDDIGMPSGLARIGPTADDVAADFHALGITHDPRAFEEGRRLIADLQRTGLSSDEAIGRAQDWFSTGSTVPVATPIDQTDRLIKLVPQGKGAPNGSAFWLTESDYRLLQADPTNAPGRLGLPAKQYADTYDVYMMRPANSGAVVYQSTIAPTRQGSYLQPGGLRQTLVINPQLFTPPALTDTFRW